MLKSMTGYGTTSVSEGKYDITAEIKTLNSKFADISVRLPSQWASLELPIRKIITDHLQRGKISVNIDIASKAPEGETIFDEELLNNYYKQFKKASEKLGHNGSDLFSMALHAPGVLKSTDEEVTTDISISIVKAVEEAIDKTNEFRIQEGSELEAKLHDYLGSIGGLLKKVDHLDKERIERIGEKLKQGLAKANLSVDADENRFEQELIYYIEKLDINEEKVRLANHISYFEQIMEANEPNGKKLGFLAQEIGREINTIGSKANSASIQRIVVEMKEELEKIKEQLLNVL